MREDRDEQTAPHPHWEHLGAVRTCLWKRDMQRAFRNNTLQVQEVLVSLICTNIISEPEQETESQMLYFLPNSLLTHLHQ